MHQNSVPVQIVTIFSPHISLRVEGFSAAVQASACCLALACTPNGRTCSACSAAAQASAQASSAAEQALASSLALANIPHIIFLSCSLFSQRSTKSSPKIEISAQTLVF
jgi:hypothetical protein